MSILTKRKSSCAAFSLVEVALALGIVSFVIVSMLGTMSVGIEVIRKAKNDVSTAQILSRIATSVAQADYAKRADFADGSPYYFDQSGRELPVSDQAPYRATISLSQNNSAYPGAPSTLLQSSAQKWVIEVDRIVPGNGKVIETVRSAVLTPKS